MSRRVLLFLAVAVVGTALAPLSQASAHTDLCTGSGTMYTYAPLTYPATPTSAPGLAPAALTNFALALSLGSCITKFAAVAAVGTVHGYCGFSFGYGVTNNNHTFQWFDVGTVLVFYGHLIGVLSMAPDTLSSENCLTGAARFLVTGSLALTHCLLTTTILSCLL